VSFNIFSTDRISIVGDSITQGYLSPQNAWWKNANFLPTIQAFWQPNYAPVTRSYANTSGNLAGSRFASFNINGFARRKITDVSPSIMSYVAARSTAAIIQLGINDLMAGASMGTITTAVNKIRADLLAGGVSKLLWVGPFSYTENWKLGVDGVDTCDAVLAGLLAGYGTGCDYVSWRNVYRVWEPVRNPGGAESGVFTVDGTHPQHTDTVGMGLLIGAINAKIALA
jgi:hypothetical protein